MNFIGQDSRNSPPSSILDDTENANYFAFFGKPTPENLGANRRGLLASQQKKALDEIVASLKVAFVAFGSMSIFSVLFISFLFWKIDSEDGIVSFTAQLINFVVVSLVFLVFMGVVTGDLFMVFAGDDLTNEVVESAIGKIVWSGRRYQMRTDSRLLRSLRSRVALPPPGEYRFYYLPHTGLVVMAEEMRHASGNETSSTLLQALANANNFSHEDLAQNQNGLLGRYQENHLIRIFALYGLILLGSVVLFVSMISQILRALSTTTSILLLIIGTVLFLRFAWSAVQIVMDLWRGRVISVEGPVVRQSHRTRYHRSYYYVTGSHKFEVSEAAYSALIEGSYYRIWYVPRSKRLVSIEPI